MSYFTCTRGRNRIQSIYFRQVQVSLPREASDHPLEDFITEEVENTFASRCSDGIYKSKLTKTEHELAVLAYAARHSLSDTALEDLLKLLNLYLPESNLLDSNIALLKERCGFTSKFLKTYTFCNVCKNTVDKETESCSTPDCPGKVPSSKNKSFFMTGDLKIQLTDVLSKPGTWNSVQEYKESKASTITDITDGKAYKDLNKEGMFLYSKNNISLTLFTDGVPLFKSSGVSMWPVYLLVNEIPRNQRFLKNMILWGVWQGVGKPAMTVFLSELLKDLNDLYVNGFSFKPEKTEVLCKAMLAVATMDLQARSAVLKMTQHNGQYACVYCIQKGEHVPSGKGFCKAFPYLKDTPSRTSEQIREHNRLSQ